MGERRGTKALEMWCKRVTQGYPGVKVENMTTSWRDGMAFCAMIHHFRPDLIDFSSLDKSDILRNNEMAFRIAERHLGIPALLDAEDMAEYPVPDRLSILTYLSQFYQAFASNSASPIKKQSTESPDTSLTSLSTGNVQRNQKMEGAPPWKEPCAVCDNPVFLAQKLRVEGKLYHRTCFRCARCNAQLSTADYYETHNGQYCCETCPDEDNMEEKTKQEPQIVPIIIEEEIKRTRPISPEPLPSQKASLVAMRKMLFDSYEETDDAKLIRSENINQPVNIENKDDLSHEDSSSQLNDNISLDDNDKDIDIKIDSPPCVEITTDSISDKINLDESLLKDENLVDQDEEAVHAENDLKTVEAINTIVQETNPQPKSANPFGDDEEDEIMETSKTSTNPFDSDTEDETEICTSTPVKTEKIVEAVSPMHKPVSKNPFDSDDEEEEPQPPVPLPRTSAQPSPVPFPRSRLRGSQRSLTSMSSMGSYTSPRKKKPAPPPPISPSHSLTTPRPRKSKRAPLPPSLSPSLSSSRLSLNSDISSVKDHPEPDKLRGEEIALEISNIAEQITVLIDSHNEKTEESIVKHPQTPPPKPRRLEISNDIDLSISPTPSTSASNVESLTYQEELSPLTEKENKDSANLQRKNTDERGVYSMPKSTHGQWKRKKAPAPPLPLPTRRMVKPMPIQNIKQELTDIEIKQQGLERQGVELENKIRDKFDTETTISPYVEEMVLQLFELVNEKNEMFRKQAELMYLRRQHHLEEEHAELEYQIRLLMARPESNKTDSDKETEEQLIQRLVEVVERRDAIVQCLEMDRLREAEEDKSISTSLGIFTQSITLESQSKTLKKHKKKKDKHNTLKLDLDKDLDESEKEKKKKKWYSTLRHLKNKHL